MAHKLLIQAIYTFSDRQYLSNVGTREFPRGAEVNVIITMKNIGKSLFSGGRLTEIAASFDETAFGGGMRLRMKPEIKIQVLEPNQTIRLFQSSLTMYHEGLGWLRCKIQPDDGQPIEYFQDETVGSQGIDEWQNFYVVVNKEQLEILALLKQMLE